MAQPLTRRHDRLERTLRACNPAPLEALATDAIEGALGDIGRTIVASPRGETTTRRRAVWTRRPRRVILIATALASLAGVATAATTLLTSAHTHTYAPKWAVPAAGPGELLRVHGTDFARVASALSAGIPYPDGYAAWRDHVISMEEALQPWVVPSGQVRGNFAMAAICARVLDWGHATAGRDAARASRDASVLAGALRWNTVLAWDPHPSVSVPGDMGSHHPSTFGWAIPIISAVRRGDRAGVARLLSSDEWFYGPCSSLDPRFSPWLGRGHSVVPPYAIPNLAGRGR